MVPRTFPSTYETPNGQQRMVVFFLSDVTGLEKWVDYIPVKFTTLEEQENNSYNNNGVILVDPLSSTTNLQEWKDYIPVFVDDTADNAWTVSSDGFIPVGYFTKPTLALDFANMTTMDSRVTFSRGSNATVFDGSGVLRYAQHNLVTYSEDFATSWINVASTDTTNTEVAPDGTTTADTIIETTADSTHRISQTVSLLATDYVFSVFLKKGTGATAPDWIQLGMTGGNSAYVNFDLTNGVVGNSGFGGTGSIVSVGSGWYRCIVTFTVISASNVTPSIVFTNNNNSAGRFPSYVGSTTSDVFAWGAQLNLTNMLGGVTSSLSTYYPTVASAYYAPRFDVNPTTLEPLGLLIEEQRTNLTSYSEDATQWGAGFNMGTTLANQAIAPDGTQTADKILENTANSTHFLSQTQTTTYTTGAVYTRTVFIKEAGRIYVSVYLPGTNFPASGRSAVFNLQTGTIVSTESGVTSSIQS